MSYHQPKTAAGRLGARVNQLREELPPSHPFFDTMLKGLTGKAVPLQGNSIDQRVLRSTPKAVSISLSGKVAWAVDVPRRKRGRANNSLCVYEAPSRFVDFDHPHDDWLVGTFDDIQSLHYPSGSDLLFFEWSNLDGRRGIFMGGDRLDVPRWGLGRFSWLHKVRVVPHLNEWDVCLAYAKLDKSRFMSFRSNSRSEVTRWFEDYGDANTCVTWAGMLHSHPVVGVTPLHTGLETVIRWGESVFSCPRTPNYKHWKPLPGTVRLRNGERFTCWLKAEHEEVQEGPLSVLYAFFDPRSGVQIRKHVRSVFGRRDRPSHIYLLASMPEGPTGSLEVFERDMDSAPHVRERIFWAHAGRDCVKIESAIVAHDERIIITAEMKREEGSRFTTNYAPNINIDLGDESLRPLDLGYVGGVPCILVADAVGRRLLHVLRPVPEGRKRRLRDWQEVYVDDALEKLVPQTDGVTAMGVHTVDNNIAFTRYNLR